VNNFITLTMRGKTFYRACILLVACIFLTCCLLNIQSAQASLQSELPVQLPQPAQLHQQHQPAQPFQSAHSTQSAQLKTLTGNTLTDGSISGSITDSTGKAMQYINVSANDNNGGYGYGNTDSDGKYTITGLQTGTYTIQFDPSGYNSQNGTNIAYYQQTGISVVQGQITNLGIVQLTQGGSVSGTVTDINGKSLEGINISGNNFGYATTDANGKYTMNSLPAGACTINFDPYSYNSANGTSLMSQQSVATVVQGQVTLNINAQLSQGGSISGKVTDSTGKALAGIPVNGHTSDYSGYGYATTDANGNYSLDSLITGTYTIDLDPTSYNEQNGTSLASNQLTGILVVQGQTTKNINAQLSQGGSISGTLTDSNGKGLLGISVSGSNKDYSAHGSATTDTNGNYTLNGLSTGTYSLSFGTNTHNAQNGTNLANQRTTISLVQGQKISNINLQFSQGGSISGTVISSTGQALAGIYVSVSGSDGYGSATTDAQGKYLINGLSRGTYSVRVELSNYNSQNGTNWTSYQQTGVLVVPAQTTENINAQINQGGSVSGTVTDTNGAALSGISVNIQNWNGNSYGYATTDSNGRYTISGLLGGNHNLSFDSSSYNSSNGKNIAFDSQLMTLVQGQKTDNVNVSLRQGGSISGTLKDSVGQPISGVPINISDLNNNYSNHSAVSDSLGKYTVNGLKAGTYGVQFNQYWNQIGTSAQQWYNGKYVGSEADPVTLAEGQKVTGIDEVLEEGGIVTGTVKDPNGKTLPNVDVSVYYNYSKSGSSYYEQVGTASTDYYGNYAITNLKAGSYTLEFNPRDYNDCNNTFYSLQRYDNQTTNAKATPITVKAGSTTSGIDAQLQKGGGISGTITDSNGNPISDSLSISIYDVNNAGYLNSAQPYSNGNFVINDLPVGTYKIYFYPYAQYAAQPPYVLEYYNDKTSLSAADEVIVSLGKITTGINASLQSNGVQAVAVTGVSLNTNATTINVGESQVLSATINPSNATNKGVSWVSSNTAVATVDSNGKVVALKAGSATITASTLDGSKTATCTVEVKDNTQTDRQNIALDKEWRITFSQAVDSSTIQSNILLWKNDPVTKTKVKVDITPTIDTANSKVVIVKHLIPFVTGTSYELSVNVGVKDMSGNPLSKESRLSFTTK